MLKAMAPKPVKAEEDAGGMAAFMENMVESATPADQVKPEPETETSGAAFAAQFSQQIEQAQQEKDSKTQEGNGSWFENNSKNKPADKVEAQVSEDYGD